MRITAILALVALMVGGLWSPSPARGEASAARVERSDEYVVRAHRIYVLDRVDYLEDAWMHIRDGVIVKIGTGAHPEGVDVHDLGGASIMPGLVSVKSDLFVGADSDGIGPLYVSADKFNPFANFARAWSRGVTVARLHPPAQRFISGIGSVVRFGGASRAEVLVERADLVLNFNDRAGRGEAPYAEIRTPTSIDVPFTPAERDGPQTRMGRLASLERFLDEAVAQSKRPFDRLTFDRRAAAFLDFYRGDRPFFVDARRDTDIRQALEVAGALPGRVALYGLDEAHLMIDEIAAAKLPCVVEMANDLLDTSGGYNPVNPLRRHLGAAAALERKGVEVVLGGQNDDLLLAAALAVKGGMSESSALRAITSRPARMLGVGDRVGRLAAGRSADFIVLNDDPLATSSHVQEVWVAGRADWKRSLHAAGTAKAPRREAVVVRAGRVYDGVGGVFENGEVLIENGKVVACGLTVPRPKYARIHDAGRDAVITPGFIDTHGFLGLEGDTSNVSADFEFAELFRVPRGAFDEVARAGVTTVVVAPRRATSSGVPLTAIKTAGEPGKSLVTKELAGMKLLVRGNASVAERALEGIVKKAEAYHKAWTDYEAALAKFEEQKKTGTLPVAKPAPAPAKPSKPAETPKSTPEGEAGDPVSGTWEVTLTGGPIPEKVTVKMRLALSGSKLSGTIEDPLGSGEDASIVGTVSGKKIDAEIEIEDSPFGNPKLTGTLGAADAMTGKIVIGGMIEIDMSAKRVSRGRPKITVKARSKGDPKAVPTTAKGPKKPKLDKGLEPFRAVLSGKAGIALEAQGKGALLAASKVFARRKIPVMILDGQGMHEILDQVSGEFVAVSLGKALTRVEKGLEVLIPDELDRAGVAPLFHSDADWAAQRLPRLAQAAVREGFDAHQALRSLTSDAARYLRLDDVVGSLRPGRDGDLLIFDGEPFDVRSNLRTVIVRGKEVR